MTRAWWEDVCSICVTAKDIADMYTWQRMDPDIYMMDDGYLLLTEVESIGSSNI